MKTKIAALITALLIICIGAGGIYYISQTNLQVKDVVNSGVPVDGSAGDDGLPENQSVRIIEDPVDSKVEDWLKYIGQELGLTTLNIFNGTFTWATDLGDEEILGQAIIIDETLDTTKESLAEMFGRNGFDDNLVQLDGFYKEDLVCLIKTAIEEEAEDEETLVESGKIEIRCGLIDLEKNIVKRLLSDENSPPMAIDIIQSTSNHILGSVQLISPDEEEIGANSVETFLVARNVEGTEDEDEATESEWVLVFKGNEKILCSVIEPYNFPVDMLPECFDETTNEMVERDLTIKEPIEESEKTKQPEIS